MRFLEGALWPAPNWARPGPADEYPRLGPEHLVAQIADLILDLPPFSHYERGPV
jgi:hypothetical protein